MRSREDWKRERQERKEQVQGEQAIQKETSAPEESDKEKCEFEGPWVAKGNPPGFLNLEIEEILDSLAIRRAKMVNVMSDANSSTAGRLTESILSPE